MKRNRAKILVILITIVGLISIQTNTDAHSGRTDSSGGHKDNQNKSGLGSYHYHCGGHPAHLHTNGVCPYSSISSSSSSTSSTKNTSAPNSAPSSSTYTSTQTNKTTPAPKSTQETQTPTQTPIPTPMPKNVEVTEIQINEDISSIEVGESKKITVTITPDDATNKSFIWKSSNDEIISINQDGEIIAKKPGTAEITATTANDKTSLIKINVKELPKEELQVTKTPIVNENNDMKTSNNNNLDTWGGIATLGILGGGGYLGYRKFKKQ